MDTFFEQIISIKKTGRDIFLYFIIWIAAFLLCGFLLFVPFLGTIGLLAAIGIVYGAYKLSSMINVEYEYIVTNGIFDVDKIINKSSRKRQISFELSNVSRLEKFNIGQLNNVDKKNIIFATNQNDPQAYLMVIDKESGGANYLVFSPDERLKGAIVKFVPKFIANSAFKD